MKSFTSIFSSTDTKKIGFYIAFFTLFLELVVKSISIYQESFRGWDDIYNLFIFRYILKVPVFVFLLSLFIREIMNKRLGKKSFLFSAGLLLFAICLFATILTNWNDPQLQEFNISNIHLIGDYGYYFLLGYFFSSGFEYIEKVKHFILSGQLLLTLQIILFFNFSTFSIDIENLQHNSYIHLLLGDNFALWSILTITVVRYKQRLIFFLVSIPFLFFLSSRAALYCYIILTPIILFSINKQYLKYFLIATGILILILVLSPSVVKEYRMFAVFSGNDISMNNRIELLRTSVPDIIKNVILGDYGGFVRYTAPANTYIHNILSFWSQFGLIPFSIIVAGIIIVSLEIAAQFKNLFTSVSLLFINLSVFMLAGILIAKSYTYAQFFMLFGFVVFFRNTTVVIKTDKSNLRLS